MQATRSQKGCSTECHKENDRDIRTAQGRHKKQCHHTGRDNRTGLEERWHDLSQNGKMEGAAHKHGQMTRGHSRKDGTTVHTTWCRADSAQLVQFVHSVVRTVVLCTDMLCVYVVQVSRARAVLPLRVAALRVAHCAFISFHSISFIQHASVSQCNTDTKSVLFHTHVCV